MKSIRTNTPRRGGGGGGGGGGGKEGEVKSKLITQEAFSNHRNAQCDFSIPGSLTQQIWAKKQKDKKKNDVMFGVETERGEKS